MPSTISRMSRLRGDTYPSAQRLYTPAFWLACAIHFSGGMSFGMFLLFPLFIRALGGDELTIGVVLGTGLAASVALRPLVGTLLDRVGRRRVLLWSGAVNALSFVPFLFVGHVGALLFVLATVRSEEHTSELQSHS